MRNDTKNLKNLLKKTFKLKIKFKKKINYILVFFLMLWGLGV